ncbi:cytochrome b/b6 domain-containing protein [Microbacterium sp. MM2322]|uniref:cytochrome b/b6 domain-containing protein n=1 Tax=Microbacterium sp. MM2322 TaxID=3157631 RepID=UPI0032D5768F
MASPQHSTHARRGLPRERGGEAWPPPPVTDAGRPPVAGPATPVAVETPHAPGETVPAQPVDPAATAPTAASDAPVCASDASAAAAPAVRRGLPRATGGDPWPPADTAPVAPAASAAANMTPGDDVAPAAPAAANATPADHAASAAAAANPTPADHAAPATANVTPGDHAAPAEPHAAPPPPALPTGPLVERRLAHAGVARRAAPAPKPEPARIGPFTKSQWAGVVVLGGAGVLYVAAMAVLAIRWILSLEPMQDFLTTYPGEYHLPDGAPIGLPAWLNWSHFLNAFFMVLIIRTGLQVRSEKRPSAFWISKKDRKRRMSLTLWLHQALDILWLANGLIFVVLLFATGQWMRVVPTSWEVFPNALSAALQYVSLDWPTENGWVNYNALQQIAYFTTIFIAAPVAAITGYRMSAMWPKKAAKLNELYPVEWARKLHFPTMLYFVVFIIVHVALVLSTGALRNLNHMYAATGSVDPDAYADNWAGFWLFAVSIAVTAGAYVAMRPLVVAPIARLFGEVKSR